MAAGSSSCIWRLSIASTVIASTGVVKHPRGCGLSIDSPHHGTEPENSPGGAALLDGCGLLGRGWRRVAVRAAVVRAAVGARRVRCGGPDRGDRDRRGLLPDTVEEH